MKKVFQIKLKNITRLLAVVIVASLATFTGCKSYDSDITGLQGQITKVVSDVAALQTSVAALQSSVNGMTYIKSITLGTDGKLTITPSAGSAIVYDAKNYVTYDISLTGNNLMVNGVNKGTVTIPALTFGTDGKLMSGTTLVADLTGFIKSGLTLGTDNYLYINGAKTSVLIPAAAVAAKSVKDLAIVGNDLVITYSDATTKTIANAGIVATTGTNGDLYINGVDTKVVVKNTFGVAGGLLTVNGVATTVAIPDATKNVIILNKVGGVVVSTTITDANGATATIKVNPATEVLAGLLFVPKIIDGGVNAVDLAFIVDTTRVYSSTGAVTNLVYGSGAIKALFSNQTVIFRINPTSADLSKTTWNFVTNSAIVRAPMLRAPGDATTLFAAPTATNLGDGSASFPLKVGVWAEPAAGQTRLFALQATAKDFYSDSVKKVVSDYVKVVTAPYNAYISNKTISASFVHYTTVQPVYTATNDFSVVYNAATKTNLNALVLASAANVNGTVVEKSFADYNFGAVGTDYNFTFEKVKTLGADGVTDQDAFINIESNGDVTVLNGTAAIDRTPVIKVTLKSAAGKVLAWGYIKLGIAAASNTAFTYNLAAATYNYNKLFVGAATVAANQTAIPLTWDKLNTDVLPILGLSNAQFQALYSAATPTVSGKFNNVAMSAADLALIATPLVWTASGTPGVDSYVVKYNVTPLAKFGTYVLTYTLTPATGAPVNLVFTFTVNKPVLDKSILAGYQYGGSASDVLTQGTNYGSGYAMNLYLGEGFGYGSTALRAMFGVATANKIDGALHQITFKVNGKGTYQIGASLNLPGTEIPASANTTPANYPASLLPNVANGLGLDAVVGTSGQTGILMALTTPLTVAEKVYAMNFYTYYPNTEKDSTAFNVHFQNPISIVLANPASNNPGFRMTDVITGQQDTIDVAPNYNVMFGNKIAIARGVAQTTYTATTVNAADFGIVATPTLPYGLNYAFSTNMVGTTTPYGYAGISLWAGHAPSMLLWMNNGTQLNSLTAVANITPTITTSYATATKAADVVYVKPATVADGIKRK